MAMAQVDFVALLQAYRTEDNLTGLRAQGYRYLVVSRERQRQFDPTDATALESAGGESVSVQRVEDSEGREVRLYCNCERRARKEQGISQRFAERFEAGLQALADGLTRPRTKAITKLWERIGRLKEKSHGAGQHYRIAITPDPSGTRAQAIDWQRQPVEGTLLTIRVYCAPARPPTSGRAPGRSPRQSSASNSAIPTCRTSRPRGMCVSPNCACKRRSSTSGRSSRPISSTPGRNYERPNCGCKKRSPTSSSTSSNGWCR